MTPLKSAIYTRVSTGKQEGNSSLTTQEDACQAYAASNGYIVDGRIYREVFTGAALDRPELSRLLEAAKRRLIDVVVVYDPDRLSRDMDNLIYILVEMKMAGIDVRFVQNAPEDSPEGRLMLSITSYVATVERLKIRERTMRGRRARVQAGRPLAGARPIYGYRWRPDILDEAGKVLITKPGLDENPSTSWVVRRIFAEAIVGRGQWKIAEGLNHDGIPSPSGRSKWHQSSIRCILTNPAYAGRASNWRVQTVKEPTRDGRRKLRRRARPENEQIALPEGTVPALIEAATWESVQQRFALNMVRKVTSSLDPEASLLRGGYGRCGYCGSSLTVHRRAKYPSYRCARHQRFKNACPGVTISVDRLDGAAWSRVAGILADPKTIARELERLRAQDPMLADLEKIERSIARVDRQVSTLVNELSDCGPLVAKAVRAKLTALEKERDGFSTEREQLLIRNKAWATAQARLAEVEEWCRVVAENMDELAYDQRRLALDALGLKVRVWQPQHGPHYEIEAGIPLDDEANEQLSISTSRSGACARRPCPGC